MDTPKTAAGRSKTFEDETRALVARMIRDGRKILHAGVLNAADRKGFENRLKDFRCRFADMTRFVKMMNSHKPNRLAANYSYLGAIIFSSFSLGSAFGVSEKATKFHARQRGVHARATRLTKDAPQIAARREEVLEAAKKIKKLRPRFRLAVSEKCADQIKANMKDGERHSISKIKRDIKFLKTNPRKTKVSL